VGQLACTLTVFVVLDKNSILQSALEKSLHHDSAAFIESLVGTRKRLIVGFHIINFLEMLFRGIIVRPHFTLGRCRKNGNYQKQNQAKSCHKKILYDDK